MIGAHTGLLTQKPPAKTLQESDVVLAVASLMTLVVGLLADLIVAQRRESR